jgi:hypothetical protein
VLDLGWLPLADGAGQWTGGAELGVRLCFCLWGMLYNSFQARFPAAMVQKTAAAFQKSGLLTPSSEAPEVALWASAALVALGHLCPGASPGRLLEHLAASLGGGDDKDWSAKALAALAATAVDGGAAALEPSACIRALAATLRTHAAAGDAKASDIARDASLCLLPHTLPAHRAALEAAQLLPEWPRDVAIQRLQVPRVERDRAQLWVVVHGRRDRGERAGGERRKRRRGRGRALRGGVAAASRARESATRRRRRRRRRRHCRHCCRPFARHGARRGLASSSARNGARRSGGSVVVVLPRPRRLDLVPISISISISPRRLDLVPISISPRRRRLDLRRQLLHPSHDLGALA